MNDLCLNESEKASVRDQERLFLRTIEKVTATFKHGFILRKWLRTEAILKNVPTMVQNNKKSGGK